MIDKKSNFPSIAIIARVGSSRYPQKVLREINGKSFIQRTIERVKYCELKKDIFLIIPESSDNDILKVIAEENNIFCFRGNKEDVLSRIFNLCKDFNISNIVRINGDCPFIDPKLIDFIIDIHLKGNYDYTSNIIKDSYPIGMHVEAIKFKPLKQAFELASLKIEREHVTPYIYNRPDIFKIKSIISKTDNSDLRICIDYPGDFLMAKHLIKKTNDKLMNTNDLVKLIRNDKELLKLCSRYHKKQSIKY